MRITQHGASIRTSPNTNNPYPNDSNNFQPFLDNSDTLLLSNSAKIIPPLTFKGLFKSDSEKLIEAAEAGNLSRVQKYAAKVNDINCRNKYGNTPLHMAASKGHLEITKWLGSRPKIDINSTNTALSTPLHAAAQNGHLALVQWLVTQPKINLNGKTAIGRTPLHNAAYYGHSEIVKLLLNQKGIDLTIRTNTGQTALDLAQLNHKEHIKSLIQNAMNNRTSDSAGTAVPPIKTTQSKSFEEQLCDATAKGNLAQVRAIAPKVDTVNCLNKDYLTPLHIAAANGHLEILQYLAKQPNAYLNDRTGYTKTPLHLAASNGHLNIVKWLASQPLVNLGARTYHGASALHLAALEGNTDIVKFLLQQKSIDPTQPDYQGKTALDFAKDDNIKDLIQNAINNRKASSSAAGGLQRLKAPQGKSYQELLLEAADTGHLAQVRELAPKAENINCVDKFKRTPIHLAAKNGHLEVVKWLSGQPKVDINCRSVFQETPLHLAACNGQIDTVKWLANHPKIDINCKDTAQWTPLHMAARNGHEQTVEFLIRQRNINLEHQSKEGKTALDVAQNDATKTLIEKALKEKHTKPERLVEQEKSLTSTQTNNKQTVLAHPVTVDENQLKHSANPISPKPYKPLLKTIKHTPPSIDWDTDELNPYADWDHPTPPASILGDSTIVRPESSLSQASFAYRPHAPSINQALLGVASTASVFSNDSSIRPESSVSQVSFLHRLHPPSIQQVLKSDTSSAQDASSIAMSQTDTLDSQNTSVTNSTAMSPQKLSTVQDILKILAENKNKLTDEEVERLAPFLDKKVAKEVGTLLRQNQTTQQSKDAYERRLLLLQHSAFDNNPQLNPDKRMQSFWKQVSDYFSR